MPHAPLFVTVEETGRGALADALAALPAVAAVQPIGADDGKYVFLVLAADDAAVTELVEATPGARLGAEDAVLARWVAGLSIYAAPAADPS